MRRRFMMQQGEEKLEGSPYRLKGKFTDDSTEDVWVWRPNNLGLIGEFEHIPVDPVTKEFDLYIQEQSWAYFEPPLSSCKSLFSVGRGDANCLERIDCLPDTSQVTSMSFMFANCDNLVSADLSNVTTEKVTSVLCMFQWCSRLTFLDVSNFDMSNVTDSSSMFEGCDALTHIRCKQSFKDWCLEHRSNIELSTRNLVWEIVD